MTPVNVDRAKQLVQASALAYAADLAAIKASPYFQRAALIDNSQLVQITRGIDSVLIGQTAFGMVASFRGTLPPTQTDPVKAIPVALDWLNDGDALQIELTYSAGKCHRGFAESLDRLWDNSGVFDQVKAAAEGGRRVFLTGHSKGGALTTLAARRLKSAGIAAAGVMTFGAPRAGDDKFSSSYDAEVPNHWRFEHQDDVMPHLPPRPLLMQSLRALALFGALSDLLKKVTVPLGNYQPVGNLCFLDWSDQLDETDSYALDIKREEHLIAAGPKLILDHFIEPGYVKTVTQL
jgi:hypothetical protein